MIQFSTSSNFLGGGLETLSFSINLNSLICFSGSFVESVNEFQENFILKIPINPIHNSCFCIIQQFMATTIADFSDHFSYLFIQQILLL